MKEQEYEGAGIIFLTKQKKVLILQKPNKKWTFPGGHAELYEEPKETAIRECIEELGNVPNKKMVGYFEYVKPDTGGKCFSFLMKIQKEFVPKLSAEHIAYKWLLITDLKKKNLSKSIEQIIPKLFRYLQIT